MKHDVATPLSLTRGIAMVGGVVLIMGTPAPAAPAGGLGMDTTCKILDPSGRNGNVDCPFPALPPDSGLEVQYVSAICTADTQNFPMVAGSPIEVRAFQIFVVPPNLNAEVSYQLAIPQGPSTFFGAPTAAWTAGQAIKVYAKAGSRIRMVLNMGDYVNFPPRLSCKASLSGAPF